MSRPLRWSGALLLVLAAHWLVASGVYNWHSQPLSVVPPASLQIELVPPPPAAVIEPEIPAAVTETAETEPTPPEQKPEPKAEPKPKPKPPIQNKPQPVSRPVNVKPPTAITRPVTKPVTQSTTATPAPAPTPPAIHQPLPEQVLIAWQNRLLTHLARFKRYPDSARRRGLQGTNSLRMLLDATGRVERFELLESSGSAALDRATLQLLDRAQPLPAPPAELLEGGRVEVIAPVNYSLDTR